MFSLFRTRVLFLLGAALLLLLIAACGGDDEKQSDATTAAGGSPANISGKTVEALGIWGAEEQEDFNSMVAPWQTDTGAKVQFTGTRDVNSILTTRVAGNDPPDAAFPASKGIFEDLANEGKLTPLSACPGLEEKVKAEYSDQVLELGTVDDKLYGVLMKAGNKGTIWYNPKFFQENGYQPLTTKSTFQDLLDLTEKIAADKEAGKHDVFPWSDGEEAGGGSGFPGSDWIQQIVLGESGAEVYDEWVDHEIPYNDPKIKQAWEDFGKILLEPRYVLGGSEKALATKFSEGGLPVFKQPPEAAMQYLGSFNSGFITDPTLGFPAGLQPGPDFDFFPFPGGGATGDANIMMIFNSNPETCSFAQWMASAEAQEVWVKRGGFTSLNTKLDLAAYPNDLDRRIAQQLKDPATTFRFDADDAMPTGVGGDNGAVFTGVLAYLNGGDLDDILQQIDAAFPAGASP